MKKTHWMLLIGLFTILSCQYAPRERHTLDDESITHESITQGDLLFVALPYDYHADGEDERASIQAAVAKNKEVSHGISDTLNIIHVAILNVAHDSLFVIDATIKRGVARYPWADFVRDFTLENGSLPSFFVYRLNDTSECSHFIDNTCRFIGQPYDTEFAPNNGKMYCSELVRESYVTESGDTLFSQEYIDLRGPGGMTPPYWRRLFESIGITPFDHNMGTWPNDMIFSPCMHLTKAVLPSVPSTSKP